MNSAPSVIDAYPWYANDILGMAAIVYRQRGSVHNQILESALGIGKLLTQGRVEEARQVGVQLRVQLLKLQDETYPQPADEGQLKALMLSDDYPKIVRERIATDILGFASLEVYQRSVRRQIPGIERMR